MRPSVSLGSFAFSKICFAVSPIPPCQLLTEDIEPNDRWFTGKDSILCTGLLEETGILGCFLWREWRNADGCIAA